MPRGGRGKKIGPGIYRLPDGRLLGQVKIGDGPDARTREHVFDDRATTLQQVKEWREDARSALRKDRAQREKAQPAKGTLAADVSTYLDTIAEPQRRKFAAILMTHWSDAFGRRSRHDLTALDIKTQLATWRTTGAAVSTVNHRRTELKNFYRALDGKKVERELFDEVPRYVEDDPEPRGLPYDLVDRILEALPDRGRPTGEGKGTRPTVSKSKAILRALAYTPIPPAQLRLVQRHHVDWTAGEVDVERRRKGKGTRSRRIPLLPQGLEALRAMDVANAWGAFSSGSLYKTFQRAVKKVVEDIAGSELDADQKEVLLALLKHVRPYDLRHSFAAQAYRSSKDRAAVAALLDHRDEKTTSRYILRTIPDNVRAAVEAMRSQLPQTRPADPPQAEGTTDNASTT